MTNNVIEIAAQHALRIDAIVALRAGLVHAGRAMGAVRRKHDPDESAAARPLLDSDPPFSDFGGELLDVPATVVCAMCGSAECPGCAEERTKSGIVAVVPWERTGPVMSRMWSTARCTTRDAESFFQALPDGQVLPALRFAILSETFAAGAMLACFATVCTIVFPGFVWAMVVDGGSRGLVVRGLTLAIPGLAILLVAAHAVHGLALEMGTDPAERRISRGLRFGLYACGWDLVLGPFGFVVVAIKEGIGAAFGIAKVGMGLPRRSALAYLRSHQLEGDAAKPALRASYIAAALATVICAVFLLAAVVWLAAS
jgi:hypothetical protein